MKISLKKFIYTLVICLISFYTTNVFAINECTKEEKSRLQELANNIKIQYDYRLREDIIDGEVLEVEPIYKLKMLNSNSDLRYEYKLANESEKGNAIHLFHYFIFPKNVLNLIVVLNVI